MTTTKRSSALILGTALLFACSSDTQQPADARGDGPRRDSGATTDQQAPADRAGFADGHARDSAPVPDGRKLPDAAAPPDGFGKPDTLRDDAGGACGVVGECRLFSDYCDGCACRALGAHEPNPKCSGTIVSCFADPCMGKQAVCTDDRCVVQ